MTTLPEHPKIIQLSVPARPPRRRRSRLGEPTVRIELVVIDSDSQLGQELHHRQSSRREGSPPVVRRSLTNRRTRPPPRPRDRRYIDPPRYFEGSR